MPIDFLLCLNATKAVVPLPENGSNTIPSNGQVAKIGILQTSSGYTLMSASPASRNQDETVQSKLMN